MTHLILGDNVRQKSIEVLADTLVDLVDLERQLKAAHWNIRGRSFIALHELLDRLATEVRDFSDIVAEQIVTLGGYADASVRSIASLTTLPADTVDRHRAEGAWVARVASVLAHVAARARVAVTSVTEAGDANSADLLTGLSRSVEKQLWLVEAHLAPLPEPAMKRGEDAFDRIF